MLNYININSPDFVNNIPILKIIASGPGIIILKINTQIAKIIKKIKNAKSIYNKYLYL